MYVYIYIYIYIHIYIIGKTGTPKAAKLLQEAIYYLGMCQAVPAGHSDFKQWCPLVKVYIPIENHHVRWENSLHMAMFNSYVEFPADNL